MERSVIPKNTVAGKRWKNIRQLRLYSSICYFAKKSLVLALRQESRELTRKSLLAWCSQIVISKIQLAPSLWLKIQRANPYGVPPMNNVSCRETTGGRADWKRSWWAQWNCIVLEMPLGGPIGNAQWAFTMWVWREGPSLKSKKRLNVWIHHRWIVRKSATMYFKNYNYMFGIYFCVWPQT